MHINGVKRSGHVFHDGCKALPSHVRLDSICLQGSRVYLHCNGLPIVGALEDSAKGAAAEDLPQLQAQEGDGVWDPPLGGGGPCQQAALGGAALHVQQRAHTPRRLHARRRNLRSNSSPFSNVDRQSPGRERPAHRAASHCCVMVGSTAGCSAF